MDPSPKLPVVWRVQERRLFSSDSYPIYWVPLLTVRLLNEFVNVLMMKV
jgi:hypothetical protein